MIDKFIQKRFVKIINQINIYNRHSQRKLYHAFKNKHEKQLIIAFLYLSQIDIFKNIETLLKNENPIAIPILIRSSIDLLVLMKIANKNIDKILSHYKHQVTVDIKSIAIGLSNNELKKLSKPEHLGQVSPCNAKFPHMYTFMELHFFLITRRYLTLNLRLGV